MFGINIYNNMLSIGDHNETAEEAAKGRGEEESNGVKGKFEISTVFFSVEFLSKTGMQRRWGN
jgi:hypothetical protein